MVYEELSTTSVSHRMSAFMGKFLGINYCVFTALHTRTINFESLYGSAVRDSVSMEFYIVFRRALTYRIGTTPKIFNIFRSPLLSFVHVDCSSDLNPIL